MHGKTDILHLHVHVLHTDSMISMLHRIGAVCCNQVIGNRDRAATRTSGVPSGGCPALGDTTPKTDPLGPPDALAASAAAS